MSSSSRQDIKQESSRKTDRRIGCFSRMFAPADKIIRSISTTEIDRMGPELPVLNELARVIPESSHLGNKILLCGQHLLQTTGSLIDFMLEKKASPSRMIVVPKIYSTDEKTESKIKSKGITVIESSQLRTIDGFNRAYDYDCFRAARTFTEKLEEATKPGTTRPIDGIIGVDDGGVLVSTLLQDTTWRHEASSTSQPDIIFVEQTTSGRSDIQNLDATTINLFNCASKIIAEPPMVAAVTVENIIQKIQEIKDENTDLKITDNPAIGIIGLGNIGSAILKYFVERGYRRFHIYDRDHRKVQRVIDAHSEQITDIDPEVLLEPKGKQKKVIHTLEITKKEKHIGETTSTLYIYESDSINDVVAFSDIIVGCTGTDITANIHHTLKKKPRPVLIFSASSRQNEVLSLLKYAQSIKAEKTTTRVGKASPEKIELSNLRIKNGFDAEVFIPRLGTPCTFSNTPDAIPKDQAQLVRGLIAASFIQAAEMQNDKKEGKPFKITNYKVSPLFQLFVNITWLNIMCPKQLNELYSAEELAKLCDIKHLCNESGGELYLPFERKARLWLDKWLKEKKLDVEVDKWLKNLTPEVTKTGLEPVRIRARL